MLTDKQVRLAIAQAIDRQTLVDKVSADARNAGTTVIPPLYRDLHLEPANPSTFDPAAANATLDAGRVPHGRRRGAGLAGRRAHVAAPARPAGVQQTSQKTVEYVKDWLEEIGIEVNVKIVTEDTLHEMVGKGDFDMFEWGWVVEPDPDYQLSTFTCDQRSTDDDGTIFAGLSDSFYCDAEYDRLYAEQALETDPAARAEIVKADAADALRRATPTS